MTETKMNIDYCSTMLKGEKVRHGSPHYEVDEVIDDIVDYDGYVLIEFESGSYTRMTAGELRKLIEHGSVDFDRYGGFMKSRAIESMIWKSE